MKMPGLFRGPGAARRIRFAFAALIIVFAAPGVPSRASGQMAFRLIVTSDPSGAGVYADSALIGTTPLDTTLPVTGAPQARTVRLKIVGGESGTWFVPVLFDSIDLTPQSELADTGVADTGVVDSGTTDPGVTVTITRHYGLPLAARVASDPAGADVLLGDSLLGTTPLFAVVPARSRC